MLGEVIKMYPDKIRYMCKDTYLHFKGKIRHDLVVDLNPDIEGRFGSVDTKLFDGSEVKELFAIDGAKYSERPKALDCNKALCEHTMSTLTSVLQDSLWLDWSDRIFLIDEIIEFKLDQIRVADLFQEVSKYMRKEKAEAKKREEVKKIMLTTNNLDRKRSTGFQKRSTSSKDQRTLTYWLSSSSSSKKRSID